MAADSSISTEWDARAYHELSRPQFAWGQKVLARLPLRGDETVLDAGCGTGLLTAELLARLPAGRVIALDQSQNMIDEARRFLSQRFGRFGDRVSFLRADLLELDLAGAVDVVFSTATFHWVLDHPRLFRNLHRALAPGGLLLAQCGGGPNLARVHERAAAVMATPPYAPFFAGFSDPWEFAGAETTAQRLLAAGFVEVQTSLEEAPTDFAGAGQFRSFLGSVVLRPHLAQIPDAALREGFLDQLTAAAAQDQPPFRLDYFRLNLRGEKPNEGEGPT